MLVGEKCDLVGFRSDQLGGWGEHGDAATVAPAPVEFTHLGAHLAPPRGQRSTALDLIIRNNYNNNNNNNIGYCLKHTIQSSPLVFLPKHGSHVYLQVNKTESPKQTMEE